MKENNGRGARRQLLKKIAIVLAIFLSLVGALMVMGGFGGESIRLRQSLRRMQKQRQKQRISAIADEYGVQRIMAAEMHLINIDVDPRALKRSDPNDYEGVIGIFCELNFQAHKDDPSSGECTMNAVFEAFKRNFFLDYFISQ